MRIVTAFITGLALAACGGGEGRAPCGPDEVRIAERCVFAGDTAAADAADVTTSDSVADVATDAGDATVASDADAVDSASGDSATTTDADTSSGPTLPFFVDAYYVMSGYMGSGEVVVADCGAARPAQSGDGACFAITWTPATGTTDDWTGFYFQYPENNWGDVPGLVLPAGASRVSFKAWGAVGGESANFAVGIQAADGFQVESGYHLLGATPTEYSVSLAGKSYSDVAGAFAWFLNNPGAKSSVTFYLDDIQWEPGGVGPVAGCTDSDAANYSAAATQDDGSCTYTVSFSVDMTCPDPTTAFQSVWVTGPFCTWCADGFELKDPDHDGVYSGAWAFPKGDLEYKFMTNGFASQENLIDDAAGGGTCAPITDSATYANRKLTIGDAPTSVEAVYGRCGACP
ncbi:MAG: hypothetical protein U1F43_13105 [Myxococcota bacterium]